MKHRYFEVLRQMAPDAMPSWAKPVRNSEVLSEWPVMMRPPRIIGTGEYGAYLASKAWRERRAVVLILARHKCVCCGGKATQVHHISYERRGCEWIGDLEPTCRNCHQQTHDKGMMALAEAVQQYMRELEQRVNRRMAKK